ncbi:hypothetical protein [Gorillibacterium timonense]|uniref:hypothetical protein n=1 Tax=Gorillibacterium timonense TaxID=1689269 RepID=UPI00071D7ADA|nr:hypothetical protein [Gorillibacterium timonense]
MLNTINTKIIEDIIPSTFRIDQPIPMTFPAMCACVDMKIKKSKASDETKSKNLINSMSLCLAASGIGFLHTFDNEWLYNPNKKYANYYPDALPNDDYIKYTMKFLGYNFKIIKNNGENKDEMFNYIQTSINNEIPLLAEKVVGRLWSIISGYNSKTETIVGYHPVCNWIPDEFMLDNNPADGFCENGMFYKENWYKSIKQLVVIEGKNKEPLSVMDFVPYWLSIMEMNGTEKLYCGFKAHDAFIKLLKDDDYFEKADSQSLLRAYDIVRGMGGGLPECRVYTAGAIGNHFIKYCKSEIPESYWQFKGIVDRYFHDTHRQCWKVWRTSGDGFDFKEEFVEPFRTPEVRNKIVLIFETIRQNDMYVYEALKNCLNE